MNKEYSAAVEDAVVWDVKPDGNFVEHEIFRLYNTEPIKMVLPIMELPTLDAEYYPKILSLILLCCFAYFVINTNWLRNTVQSKIRRRNI